MSTKFNNLPRIVQILLLLIPLVSWVVEVLVRWSVFGHYKNFSHFLFAFLITLIGVIPIVGWIDVFWCLLFKHMFYAVCD